MGPLPACFCSRVAIACPVIVLVCPLRSCAALSGAAHPIPFLPHSHCRVHPAPGSHSSSTFILFCGGSSRPLSPVCDLSSPSTPTPSCLSLLYRRSVWGGCSLCAPPPSRPCCACCHSTVAHPWDCINCASAPTVAKICRSTWVSNPRSPAPAPGALTSKLVGDIVQQCHPGSHGPLVFPPGKICCARRESNR